MIKKLIKSFGVILAFPINWLWWFSLTLRRAYYKYSYKQAQFDIPIVSVGNISHGGTGKTPIVLWIAKTFERELRLAIVTRGYKSQFEKTGIVLKPHMKVDGRIHGDEPTLLIENLERTHVVVGRKRSEQLIRFLEENVKDAAILDDGFQHLKMKRDLDIVLVDTSFDIKTVIIEPLYFREPLRSLGSVDLLILTNCHLSTERRISELKQFYRQYTSAQCKFYEAHYKLTEVRDSQRQRYEPDFFKDKKVLAFCAIAKPQNFWTTLKNNGIDVAHKIAFPDHYQYTQKDLAHITSEAEKSNLFIVTTEKDFVKLEDLRGDKQFYWFKVDLDFNGQEEALKNNLKKVLKAKEIQL